MKICLLGDGIEMHVRRWAKELIKRNCDVLVITFNKLAEDFRSDYQGGRLEIVERPFNSSNLIARLASVPGVAFKVRKLITEFKPDIFHTHSAGAHALVPLLLGIKPRVISPWGSDILIYIKGDRIDYLLTKLSLLTSDLVHIDGDNTKSALINLGVKEEKIFKCFFGTDTEKFSPTNSNKNLRERLSIPETAPVAISIRTLTPVHDVITLIHAIPLVLSKIPDAHFLICGPGVLRQQLEDEVKQMGLGNSVHFLGRLNEEQIAEAMNISCVYVSTSISESGLAGSTAEAMSSGLPIINTDTGDIREWIEDGVTGYITTASDVKMLSDRIVRTIQSTEMRENAKRLNRKAIEERNNIKIQMDLMLNAYQSVSQK